MNFNDEEKKILISAWLNGSHLEDIALIPLGLFEEYAGIVKLIKDGETNVITIAKKAGVKITDLMAIYGMYEETFYMSMIATYKEQKAKEELEHAVANGSGVKEYEHIITTYYRGIDTTPIIEGLAVAEYFDELDRRAKQIPYVTGLWDVDNIINIRKGELTSISARPSTGKSTFMLQVAKQIAQDGGKVIFMPLEMTKAQTLDRLILGYCSNDITGDALKNGRLNNDQWAELSAILDQIDQNLHTLSICDNVRNIEDIENIIEDNSPDVIIIDQLQQMGSRSQQFYTVRERFSYMTANLKRIALEHDVAILLACQVSRGAAGTKPGLEHLKESGSIEEDSDNVIILSRDLEQEQKLIWYGGNRIINCQVAKQREGATGETNLLLIPNKFTFRCIERANNEK